MGRASDKEGEGEGVREEEGRAAVGGGVQGEELFGGVKGSKTNKFFSFGRRGGATKREREGGWGRRRTQFLFFPFRKLEQQHH